MRFKRAIIIFPDHQDTFEEIFSGSEDFIKRM
jgi:hypothetical protein